MMLKKEDACSIETPDSITSMKIQSSSEVTSNDNNNNTNSNNNVYRNIDHSSKPKIFREKRSFKWVLVPLPVGIVWAFLATMDSEVWDTLADTVLVFVPCILPAIGVHFCIESCKSEVREEVQNCSSKLRDEIQSLSTDLKAEMEWSMVEFARGEVTSDIGTLNKRSKG
jgi:hypothetical protein